MEETKPLSLFERYPILEKILNVLKIIGTLIISAVSGILVLGVFILGTVIFLSAVMFLFILGAHLLRFIF